MSGRVKYLYHCLLTYLKFVDENLYTLVGLRDLVSEN